MIGSQVEQQFGPQSGTEPNFIIVDFGSDEVRALIPGLGGSNALRLAELALLLPEKDARENESIILNRDESGVYHIGMLDPTSGYNEKNICRILKVDTSWIRSHKLSEKAFNTLMAIAYTGELASMVQRDRRESDEARDNPRESKPWKAVRPESTNTDEGRDHSIDAEEAQGFRADIEEILRGGSRIAGCSDMHFKPGPIYGSIYRRIDGEMYEYALDVPREEYEKLTRGLTDMAGGQDFKLANDVLDSTIKMLLPEPGGAEVKKRIRFSGIKCLDGIDISVRYLSNRFYNFHEMGHEPEQLEVFFRSLAHRHGVVLVTGSTGSGKSTLLEAMTRWLQVERQQSKGFPNIIVIADPIEFEDPRRTQIEVDTKRGLTFAKALKSALRKDPDIIIVGEIRDREVAEIAFQAATTGHLVLTTLHTNDVTSSFARLTNLGIQQYDQAGLIRSICSQTLVRRLCDRCKEIDPRSPIIAVNIIEKLFPEREDLKERIATASNQGSLFYQARENGCQYCHKTGYKGRVAVSEVYENTLDLASMLSMGMRPEQAVEFSIREYGMLTQAVCAARKLISGITSYAEVAQWLTPPPPRKHHWYPRAETNNGNSGAPFTTPAEQNYAGSGNYHSEGVVEAEYVEVHP